MNGTEIIEFLQNTPTIHTTLSAIVGSILTSLFFRKKTSTKEFEKIKAGKFEEALEDLLDSGSMTYSELYKANNFLKIAEKADKYYSDKKDEDNKEHSYNFDWFIRFYEEAGNVSNDQMQEIWAKLLAGEVLGKEKYPIRIIDVLKNMESNDAILFNKICSNCIKSNDNYFLPNYDEIINRLGLTYSDIMSISELGLIYNDSTLVLRAPLSSDEKNLIFNRNLCIGIKRANSMRDTFEIKQFPLTTIGKYFMDLFGECCTDEDFAYFAKMLNRSTEIEVSLHKVLAINNNQYTYEKKNIINEF